MIVELIGCTGAGKTSIARRLVALSQPAGDIALMPDLLLQAAHLGRVRNAQVVNVVQDVAGLPFLVSSWSDHRALIRLSWRLLHQHGGSAIGQALDLRSVLRRTGMYAMAHRRQWAPIVLFDEGPLLVAYHIYGYTSAPFGERELEEFAHLAPTPDRIVYVKAPIDALVERATSRPDRRRQLAGRDRDVIEQSLRRATSLFDGLAATPSLRDRVIIVDGSDGTLDDDRQLMALADELRSTRSSLDEHHGSMHHDGGRR